MPPRIEPIPQPQLPPVQFQAMPRRENAAAAAPAATPRRLAGIQQPRFTVRPAAEVATATAERRAAVNAPGAERAITLAPAAPARAAGLSPAAAALAGIVAGAAPAAAAARPAGPAVEPIQQQLPERVVEMLNAQRGREAVTQIARAAAAGGPAVGVSTQGIAEPRVVVEPAAPAVEFAPAPAGAGVAVPANAGTARMAGVANQQVRQAEARQAFQTIAANTAPQPMGTATRPRAIIDQRI